MAQKSGLMKIASDSKPISYVVEGATLECSKGTSTCQLCTPGRKSIQINGKLQANINDSKPNKNIKPFGKCKHGKKKPYTPKIYMSWIGGKDDLIVEDAPVLLSTSRVMCVYGGSIKIENDGQTPKTNS
jgi:hypothetical protein